MELEAMRRQLDEKIPGAVLNSVSLRGEDTISVKPEQIRSVCRLLHDEFNFNFLTDLCGMDYTPHEPRFGIVYHLCNLESRTRLRIKIALPGPDPAFDSVTSVWKAANWLEREAFDMYGIYFEGHPELQRILTPPGFQDFPLRKDYPIHGK